MDLRNIWILLVQAVLITGILIISPGPSSADATLEILDVYFPGECGAPFAVDAVECSRCHSQASGKKFESISHQQNTSIRSGYRSITSLDESSKLTVFVPAQSLKQAVPFTQTISIHGGGVRFRYGYRHNREPFVLLENRWLSRARDQIFLEEHSPAALPLLVDPGEYIFRADLLYYRSSLLTGDAGWSRIILLWTVNVNADGG